VKIFVIGPAGCGKSSFVKSFSEYLRDMSEGVRCVNLDPATDPVFKADKDVRSFVKTDEVMKKYGLGINGGLLKSMDEVLFYVKDLDMSGDYVIYDTPGQMEIFIYSSSGRRIIEKLSDKTTVGLFLMDSSLVTDPESFLSAVLQNVIVSLRLSIPTATVLTKKDVADVDVEKVMEEISRKNSVLAELLEKTSYFIEYTTLSLRVVKVSSFDETGFDDVYSLLDEMFCACGDLS